MRNLELAKECRSLIPFVGIHPEIFAKYPNLSIAREKLDEMVSKLARYAESAIGIGEIGLDPKYGQMELQEYLLKEILRLAETLRIPITLHSRETTSKLLDELSSYSLHCKILFHWFAGSESELGKLHGKGYYSSFGPSILFSKRIIELVKHSEPGLILTETDCPTIFRSLNESPSTPLLVSSVAFKLGMILHMPMNDVCELISTNAREYLATQD